MMNREMQTRCTRCDMRGMYHQKTSARHFMSQEAYRSSPNPYLPSYIPEMPSNDPSTPSTLSCHMTPCATWRTQVQHDSFICDMTHSYVTWLIHMWHDSRMCGVTHSRVTWLIHVWFDSFTCDMTHSCVTWLIHMWHDSCNFDMTDPYIHLYSCLSPAKKAVAQRQKGFVFFWSNSHICTYVSFSLLFFVSTQIWEAPPWNRPTMNPMSQEPYCPLNEPNFLHVWHDSFVLVTWRFRVWHVQFIRMTGLFHMWHDSFIYDITHLYVTWLMHVWHDT